MERILSARRYTRLRLTDLIRLRLQMKKLMPFIITADHHPAKMGLDSDALRAKFLPPPKQLELNFDAPPTPAASDFLSVRSGEL
jgi:predicted DNA-binding helix-hairpin-helix protein